MHYNLQAGNNAKIIYKNNFEQQICTNKELIGCQKKQATMINFLSPEKNLKVTKYSISSEWLFYLSQFCFLLTPQTY